MAFKAFFLAALCLLGACAESPQTCASIGDDNALLQSHAKVSAAQTLERVSSTTTTMGSDCPDMCSAFAGDMGWTLTCRQSGGLCDECSQCKTPVSGGGGPPPTNSSTTNSTTNSSTNTSATTPAPPTLAPPTPPPTPPLTWTNVLGGSNFVVGGGLLEKVSGPYEGDCQATSVQKITHDALPAELSWTTGMGVYFMGLSSEATAAPADWNIDFGLWFRGSGVLTLLVAGPGGNPAIGQWKAGDRITIRVEANQVQFFNNGVSFHTLTQTPAFPLVVDSLFWSVGANASNIQMKTKI